MITVKQRRVAESVLLQSVCLAAGTILLFPVFYALLVSFMKPTDILSSPPRFFPSEFVKSNYLLAVTQTPLIRFLGNSVIVSLVCATLRVIVASLAAYGFSFFNFRGKNVLFFFVLGTMLIPSDTTIVTNYMTVSGMGLVNTYLGIMILYFVSANNIFLMRQYFLTVSKELKEAAEIDGCGSFRFYTSILMPVARPVVATVFISSFVSTWNMYLWPMLITTRNEMRTVQVGITMLNFTEESNYGATMAGAVIVLIPSLAIFIISQKHIVSGMTTGSVKG